MISLTTVRGGHFSKTFSIFYMLNMCNKNRVLAHIFELLGLSNEKNSFVENSRVEPTIFFMEKNSFSLKLL